MSFVLDVLFWGLIAGIVHYIIMGILYQNPFVMRFYERSQKEHPSVKVRKNTSDYLTKQFIGTQIEIWIMTASYMY